MAGYDFNVALSGSSSATSGVRSDNRFSESDFIIGTGAKGGNKTPAWIVPVALAVVAVVAVLLIVRK